MHIVNFNVQFFFQFCGFESLVIFPKTLVFTVEFTFLKPKFPRKICHQVTKTHPKKNPYVNQNLDLF
jgi:hypothetical protein